MQTRDANFVHERGDATHPPHHVVARVGANETTLALIAAVEGHARLIEAVPARRASGHDLRDAIADLRRRTGFPLPADGSAINGVIVDAPPSAVLLIGERTAGDAAVLAALRDAGVAHYLSIPSVPPERPSRDGRWIQAALAAWHGGDVEAICAVLPPGSVPAWADQLFGALAAESAQQPPLLVIDPDTDAAQIPWFAHRVTRGEGTADGVADGLAAIAGSPHIAGIAPAPRCAFRSHALITAMIAAQSNLGTAVWYCDIGAGTTLIAADAAGVRMHNDRQHDCGARAAAVLADDRRGDIARWLPPEITPAATRAWALRRAAAPGAILTDPLDRTIAAVFARVALVMALNSFSPRAAPCETLILGPGWLRWSVPEDALRVVLDVLSPARPVSVMLDHDDLLATAGLLTRDRPDYAASVFTHDVLHPLGTLFAPAPEARAVRAARTIAMSDAPPVSIAPDSVTRIPIAATDTRCELTHAGAPPHTFHVSPSEFGLWIDTRARPLTADHAPAPRASVSDRLRPPSG